MTTAQVRLTDSEGDRLRAMAKRTGKSPEQLLREAVTSLLAQTADGDRLDLLRQGFGMWSDRQDLPDFRALRLELDRQ